MSDLLSIGRAGVVAYRAALSAVGENVTNAETEGYSRRTVALTESNLSSSSSYQYRSQAVFGGSMISSVQRVADEYKAAYARFSTSEDARASTKATWLGTAENALDDSDTGLGVKMSAVFTSAENLTTDVNSNPNRQQFMAAVTDAATQFNTTAKALKDTADGISTAALTSVAQLNDALKTLSQINTGLRRSATGSAASAQLLDQRDATLNQISSIVSVDVRFEDDGRASVTLAGNTTAKLVDSAKPETAYLGVVQAGDGRLSLIASGGLIDQMTIQPQSGSLAALVDVADTVASRRQSLNTIATSFADTINTWNKAGIDQAGNPGADLLNIGTGGAATITTATQDVSKIAAGSPAVGSTPAIANGNALALKDTRTSTGPEAQWALLVSTHAQVVSSATAQATAAASQKQGALTGLDEVTGVDLDVEAAQLLRYQQAYSGSSKIIQVARETLQEIMNLFN